MKCYEIKTTQHGDHCLKFRIVQIGDTYEETPGEETTYYGRYEDNITDPDKAKYEAEGYIKWDGCANISYGEECIPHFCGYEQFKEFQEALDSVWQQARELFKDKYPEFWMKEEVIR